MKISDVVTTTVKGLWGTDYTTPEGGIAVIKTNNMSYEGVIDYSDICYRNIEVEKAQKNFLKYGDILAEKSGGTKTHTVGYVNYFDGQSDKFVCNNFILVIRPNVQKIKSKFLFYQMRYMYENGIFADCYNRTTGIQNLQVNSYLSKDIKVFSEDKQESVISLLDSIIYEIDNLKKRVFSLDELVKSRFIEMFGEPLVNEYNFPKKKLSDTFLLSAGGTPKTDKKEYWDNGTISWIGSNMCQNQILYQNDGKYITELGLKNSSAKIFDVDTVLIALVGATIGKTALLKFPTATNQNVLGIQKIANAAYNPYFVYYYMQGLYDRFIDLGDGKFKMASKGFVGDLEIFVVDLHLQNEFAEFVKLIDKSKFIVQQQIKDLQELLDSKMDEYFR